MLFQRDWSLVLVVVVVVVGVVSSSSSSRLFFLWATRSNSEPRFASSCRTQKKEVEEEKKRKKEPSLALITRAHVWGLVAHEHGPRRAEEGEGGWLRGRARWWREPSEEGVVLKMQCVVAFLWEKEGLGYSPPSPALILFLQGARRYKSIGGDSAPPPHLPTPHSVCPPGLVSVCCTLLNMRWAHGHGFGTIQLQVYLISQVYYGLEKKNHIEQCWIELVTRLISLCDNVIINTYIFIFYFKVTHPILLFVNTWLYTHDAQLLIA